jgi:hypothetical protein
MVRTDWVDRVVHVGEPVGARRAACRAPPQCVDAVAGALRLGTERPVRLAPRRQVRHLLSFQNGRAEAFVVTYG